MEDDSYGRSAKRNNWHVVQILSLKREHYHFAGICFS
eukprot:CCRYP_017552-RA/>CCRYP_017552-RA protein AED:0.40 eAED:0.40 QI:21/1/1/1/0/0/2/71/36